MGHNLAEGSEDGKVQAEEFSQEKKKPLVADATIDTNGFQSPQAQQELSAEQQQPQIQSQFFKNHNNPDSSLLGKTLGGRYELTQLLGEGGMSAVFLSRHKELDQLVAIKVLRYDRSIGQDEHRRFLQEAKATYQLLHPNLIRLLDFSAAEGELPYLVMEFVSGTTLSEALQQKRRFEVDEFINVFSQVCDGLAYAHSKGIVHRDLKPSNIMLAKQPDGSELVKIVDFGIAKMAHLENQQVTKTGEIFGSPLYMSPEQCQALNPDHRSDLYSLGCAMYECLSGSVPFQGKNSMQTLFMHIESPVPSISFPEYKTFDTARRLDAVLQKLLQKDPENRYQSALELKQALSDCLVKPQAAVQARVAPPVKNPSKLNKPLVAGLLLASVAAVAVFAQQIFHGTPATPDSVASKHHIKDERVKDELVKDGIADDNGTPAKAHREKVASVATSGLTITNPAKQKKFATDPALVARKAAALKAEAEAKKEMGEATKVEAEAAEAKKEKARADEELAAAKKDRASAVKELATANKEIQSEHGMVKKELNSANKFVKDQPAKLLAMASPNLHETVTKSIPKSVTKPPPNPIKAGPNQQPPRRLPYTANGAPSAKHAQPAYINPDATTPSPSTPKYLDPTAKKIQSLVDAAVVKKRAGDEPSAEAIFAQAMKLVEQMPNKKQPVVRSVYFLRLALIAARPDAGKDWANEALAAKKVEELIPLMPSMKTVNEAQTFGWHGHAMMHLGKYAEAYNFYRQATQIAESAGPEGDERWAQWAGWQARALVKLNQYPAAIKLCDDSIHQADSEKKKLVAKFSLLRSKASILWDAKHPGDARNTLKQAQKVGFVAGLDTAGTDWASFNGLWSKFGMDKH